MGLRIWDQLQDPYDHNQLADNWAKVDQHDHSPGRGVLIPTEGIADQAITQAKLASGVSFTPADNSVTTAKILDGTLTAADMNPTFANGNVEPIFASPKPIHVSRGSLGVVAAGTYYFTLAGTTVANSGTSSGGGDYFVFDPADWAAGTRTAKLSLQATILTNVTAPAANFTVGLYTMTGASGGAGVNGITLGTLTGNTAVLTSPTGPTQALSTAFNAPAFGAYALGVVVSGTTATNSFCTVTAKLRVLAA